MRPRLLDLCCGAGGAGKGYHQAGFDVIGVDVRPQPNYPFEFHQLDATALVRDAVRGCWHENAKASSLPGMSPACLGRFDAVHASPPCKASTSLRHLWPDRQHADLIDRVRELLVAWGIPYVIENVPGAALRDPLVLCGSMFGLGAAGRQLRRHRLFECSFPVADPPACRHEGSPIGVYGTGSGGQHRRGFRANADESREALDTPWMTKAECSQAIPPAYTEFVGAQLMAVVQSTEAAA